MVMSWIGAEFFGMLLSATPAMAAEPTGCTYFSRSGDALEAWWCVRDDPRMVSYLVARLWSERGLVQVPVGWTG